MPRPAMQRTVTLHVGWVPEVISRSDFVHMLKERFGSWKLLGVQFLPRLKAQLTFDSVEAHVIIEKNTEIDIGGYPCPGVGGGGSEGRNVLVFHLPYELNNEDFKVALQCFGSVHSVHHQHHPDTSIHTGMRIVHMIRGARIPWHMYVDGWSAKGWYPGQPVKCDICGEGHVSRVRPLRGKCRFCKEEGHFACNCPNNNRNDWGEVSADGTAPANATPADSAPSSGAISDLRDDQLNELTGSVAPGSAALSESLNNNATSTANSNINNESEIHSNDSSGNNENSESIMHSNNSSGNNGNS